MEAILAIECGRGKRACRCTSIRAAGLLSGSVNGFLLCQKKLCGFLTNNWPHGLGIAQARQIMGVAPSIWQGRHLRERRVAHHLLSRN